MKHIEKRAVCMALALLMLVSLVPFAFADGEAAKPSFELRLGVSNYYMQVPASYERGLMTPEDVANNMVGYYKSTESLMDFDVYQFSKEGESTVLAEYAAKEAAEYDAEPVSGTLNGNAYCYYDAVKEYEGESYPTRTYILDTGLGYVEIVFWLDGETAEAEALRIIRSLSAKINVPLGSSPYSVTVPYGYSQGEVTEEERAEGLIEYFKSDFSLLDFDIFEIAKEDASQSLADFAAAQAAAFGVDTTDTAINGVPVSYYRALDTYEDVTYKILVFALDADDSFIVLRFWLDGDTAADEAMGIIKTLNKSLVIGLVGSELSITVPNSYYNGEVTEEEAAEGLVAYYKSDATLMDFDIFEIAKADQPEALADFAAAQAAEYGVTVTDTVIKGIPVSYYRALVTIQSPSLNLGARSRHPSECHVEKRANRQEIANSMR